MNSPVSNELPVDPFLPLGLRNRLAVYDEYAETLTTPKGSLQSAEYQVGMMLPYVLSLDLEDHLKMYVSTFRPRIRTEFSIDTDELTHTYVSYGFNTLKANKMSGLFAQMGALVTGAAYARGDDTAGRQGVELSRRIIVERAQNAGIAIINCCSELRSYIEELDPDLGSPYKRATDYWEDRHRRGSPLLYVPKSHGSRMENLTRRLEERDFKDVTPKIYAKNDGVLARYTYLRQLRKSYRRLSRRAANPAHVTGAIEEAFDTAVYPPIMEMEDSDPKFIANFGSKLEQYHSKASQGDESLARDPRVRLLGLMISELAGLDTLRELSLFKERVAQVSKRELELSNSL
jgi:hypothetical protein